jgi:hypothetical protein
MLQLEHIYEIFGSQSLCRSHFREFQRTTQVRPRTPTVDYGFYAQTSVNILARILAQRGRSGGKGIFSGDLAKQRRSGGQANKTPTTKIRQQGHSRASVRIKTLHVNAGCWLDTHGVSEDFNFRVWHLYHNFLDSSLFILFDYESFRISLGTLAKSNVFVCETRK